MGVGVGMLVFAVFVEVEREERDWVGWAVTAAELVLAGRGVEGEVAVVAAVGGGGPEVVVVEHEVVKCFASDFATFHHHVEIEHEFPLGYAFPYHEEQYTYYTPYLFCCNR